MSPADWRAECVGERGERGYWPVELRQERFIVKLGGVSLSVAVKITPGDPWTYYPVTLRIAGPTIGSRLCLTAMPVDGSAAWPIIDALKLVDLGPA